MQIMRAKSESLLSHSPGFGREVGGRDCRPLCEACATWTTLQRSRESTAQPFRKRPTSSSGQPEASCEQEQTRHKGRLEVRQIRVTTSMNASSFVLARAGPSGSTEEERHNR